MCARRAMLLRITSEKRYAPMIPSTLPIAAPISRFRLIRRSRHSKIMMAVPSKTPSPASWNGERLKGWIRKQVRATKAIKMIRTMTRSTEGPPSGISRKTD